MAFVYTAQYASPLGEITLACNEDAIIGLWFNDQKHFGATLPAEENPTAVAPSGNRLLDPNGHPPLEPNGHPLLTPDVHHLLAPDGHPLLAPNGNPLLAPDVHPLLTWDRHPLLAPKGNPLLAPDGHQQLAPNGHPVLEDALRWLDLYFFGQNPDSLPPLRYGSTPFRKAVYDILLTIPYGETMTYGQIAAKVAEQQGIEKMSAQAVGGAVGRNPIALMIPCHRVVGAGGNLTGYAGGMDRKLKLLELEKADTSHFFMPAAR